MQAWKSDELKDDWELERSVDAGQGGSRTVRLRGAGGIVDSVFTSGFLGDMMQAQPPCSATDCFELNDDAALEVRSPAKFQRALMIVPMINNYLWQATREACTPVQLLQLLHPDQYPEESAVSAAMLARAARQNRFSSFLSRIADASWRRVSWEHMYFARRLPLLALLLLAAVALFKLGRNNIFRILQILLRYRRR